MSAGRPGARGLAGLVALLVWTLPAARASSQDERPLPDAPRAGPEEKLEAWPELERDERKAVELEISKLRKGRTEEMIADAEAFLAGASAGAVPLLLGAFAKEKDEAATARLLTAMERLIDARHTRLLGAEFGHRDARARTFCMRRSAAFPDPGLSGPAAEALERVLARGDEADSEERYAAALASAASGGVAGLALLLEPAARDWRALGAELRVAASGARGPRATEVLAASLAGERSRAVGALRLLGSAGDESAVEAVAPFLDEDDNQLRVAAINALRGIVDGEGPIENLSVFRAIEVAKEWKARIGR